MSQHQRVCIFCGGYGLTKEHIWPKWCAPLFEHRKAEEQLQINMQSIGDGALISAPSYVKRPGSVITKKLRVVCKPCNNRWMGSLEAAVMPIMTPLILAQPSLLSLADQRKVAEWIALKVMVAEHSEAGNHVTSECDRRAFRDALQIPQGFEARIGRCGKGRWKACFFRVAAIRAPLRTDEPNSPPKNIQSIVFGVGELLLFAFTSPDRDLTIRSDIANLLPTVWPLSGMELSWPPTDAISEQQADNLAHGLEQLMVRPDGARLPLPRI